MLQVAKGKKIYKSIICEYVGPKRLDIEDGMIKEFRYYRHNLWYDFSTVLNKHLQDISYFDVIKRTYMMHSHRAGDNFSRRRENFKSSKMHIKSNCIAFYLC